MKQIALFAALALALPACRTARPPGSPPETKISILDKDGTSLSGETHVLGLDVRARDNCTQFGDDCAVAVPTGVYLVKFFRQRGGRVSSLHSGGSSARSKGCLMSRIRVEPGKTVVCKSNGGFDRCRRSRVHTMNCGESIAQPWVPKDDEPMDITGKEEDDDDPPTTQGIDRAPEGAGK